MTTFKVYLRDPISQRVTPEEELPQLHQIISRRHFEQVQPNLLLVTAEPLMPYLERTWVPPPEHLDVWLCRICHEIQPRRGERAFCAGSATEGNAHEDTAMLATTVTFHGPIDA